MSTSIYYTRLGGFDTHANQSGQHDNLLREMGASLQAFLKDLNDAGHGKRVVVMVFLGVRPPTGGERQRRTDHGTAAPVFSCARSSPAWRSPPVGGRTPRTPSRPRACRGRRRFSVLEERLERGAHLAQQVVVLAALVGVGVEAASRV